MGSALMCSTNFEIMLVLFRYNINGEILNKKLFEGIVFGYRRRKCNTEEKDYWLRINIENLFGIGYYGLCQEFMVYKLKCSEEQEPTDE